MTAHPSTFNHLSILPADDLHIQQLELEQGMAERGAELFWRRIRSAQDHGREHTTGYGQRLMDVHIEKLAARLDEYVASFKTGRAGRHSAAFKYLEQIGDNRKAAFIAMRAVMQGFTQRVKRTTLAGAIGMMLEDEQRLRDAKQQARDLVNWLLIQAKDRVSYDRKRTIAMHLLNRKREDIPWESWPNKERIVLGALMIELLEEHGVLVQAHEFEGKRPQLYIEPAPAIAEWIKRRNAIEEQLSPLYEPMVTPPAPWSSPLIGGYSSGAIRPLRLVKGIKRDHLGTFTLALMPRVYSAVNAVQSVPWRINGFILDVVSDLWERDFSEAGVPPKLDPEVPPRPMTADDDPEVQREWRRDAHGVHQEIAALVTKRIAFVTALGTAHRYRFFSAIYFPHQYDFRGRMYAVPQFTPQGPDWMRGMLEFSEGHALDEDGATWLAIHLANCGDFKLPDGTKASKARLEDRVQWVYDHEAELIDCFTDPFANRLWTEADSPIQFLAACREWALYREAAARGEAFISHIAVALDGSCSGIQHFSMAWRDEVGGAAVNLVPSDTPADIYSLVLEKASARLEALDHDEEADPQERDMANQWRTSGLLVRSTFKRPTMTFGYGSELIGFSDQIRSDTLAPALLDHKRKLRAGEPSVWPFEANSRKAGLFLAHVTLAAVRSTVLKAGEAMLWLKQVGGIMAKSGLFVSWTAPDGFKVIQGYADVKKRLIDTMLLGRRIRAWHGEAQTTPNKSTQASALPPNVVHSWDACHLRAAVQQANDEGITSLQLIHDSFGTHAANTGRLFVILRESMVAMYEAPIVANLAAELQSQMPPDTDPLPPPPALGNLDLRQVLDTDFSFA